MTIYNLISWVNTIGFSISGIMLCKLVFNYERPTYLDRYFYWKFVFIIFGIITQFYSTAIYHNAEWFIKTFSLVGWINSIIFCIDIKKVSIKITLTAEERKERILNRGAVHKILLSIFKK